MESVIVALVTLRDGSVVWMSLEALARWRERGKVKRSAFVTVGPFVPFPACPVIRFGDSVKGWRPCEK